jgi:hypothetical protein
MKGQGMTTIYLGTGELMALMALAFGVLGTFVRWVLPIYRRYRPRIKLGGYMVGTVYIMFDKTFPGIVEDDVVKGGVIKIGYTQRSDVEVRMIEVMRDMGGDLEVVYKLAHVPFPKAVEFAAHQLMAGYRIYWKRNSRRRGREWFRVDRDDGIQIAIAAIEKAARLVRRASKSKKRWPAKADMRVGASRYVGGKILKYGLFR